jgi:hypothetical protein
MTSIADAFRSDDAPRGRFFAWTAHLLLPVAAIVFSLRVVSVVAPGLLGWVDSAAGVASTFVYLVAVCHYLFGGLCVRCMRDVPADASRQAARWRRLLWTWHHLLALGIAWLVLAVAAFGAGAWFDAAWAHLGPDVMMLVAVGAVWTHHRLRPWCPCCRDWDEEGPVEPSPRPPAGVKQS